MTTTTVTITRPRRLRRTLAAAAVLGAASAIATAPASAAVYGNFILGQDNQADWTTKLHGGASGWPTVSVDNPAIPGSRAILGGNSGVEGYSAYRNQNFAGVYGEGTDGASGVRGVSSDAAGVWGSGFTGVAGSGFYGVTAVANDTRGGGAAVLARASAGGNLAVRAEGPSEFAGTVSVSGAFSAPGRSGLLTVPAGTKTVTKTGLALSGSSVVMATLQTTTNNLYILGATPNAAASSFTVTLSANAPTGGAKVGWFIVN